MKKFHVFAVFITMGLTPCWCQTRPDHSLLDIPAVHKQMNNIYKHLGGDKVEHSFYVKADGTPSDITQGAKNSVKSEVPSDAQALIHTHEPGVSPQPSRQDIEVAKQLGCPNYELSMFALWVANPDGTTAKVGDVEMKHGELVIK